MNLLSSLTNRIFLASALLAVLSIGAALVSVRVAVSRQAERELQRGLEEAATALEEYRQALFDHYSREARLIADLPRLKAAVSSLDPPTVQPVAEEYWQQVGADLFVVTDASGRKLAGAGLAEEIEPAALPGIATAAGGRESRSFVSLRGGVLHVASVPIWIDPLQPEILGTLSVGLSLNDRTAQQFRALTNSEIAFVADERVYASTLPKAEWPALVPLFGASETTRTFRVGDEDYSAVTRSLAAGDGTPVMNATAPGPVAIILRSRTERLRFLDTVHRALAVTAVLAVLVATLLSYAIARSVTRPIRAITAVMRDMAATGDLTRQLPVAARSRWEDEDARLLADTFGTMTESIGRFQREAAQKERLSSLGRLSTIVAHEIRNPLMIIKAALRELRRNDRSPADVRHAVADIDEEVARLDRLVAEVLDFARPIRFEYGSVDLNALCRDAARAIMVDGNGSALITWRLSPDVPSLVTDRERVRMALVNILDNARQAVAFTQSPDAASVTVTTHRIGRDGVSIVIHDMGPGIAPDEMGRVFEPYFTTRRTGTGLGLAISRNIIERLGGTIAMTSAPGKGTEVRIELPPEPPAVAR